ncbi:nucleotide exchange factor GrpE [Streptomyces sp. HPF1205]|uniref:nucleotide exchange factor GrpE n=1 Tax=Streptomyces sp. HPF1205 TaxID=2873262 RepID=UPI001CEDA6B6|nr:nucleotide exchange factor GrpE [Streptomyces sp. HPF1205]
MTDADERRPPPAVVRNRRRAGPAALPGPVRRAAVVGPAADPGAPSVAEPPGPAGRPSPPSEAPEDAGAGVGGAPVGADTVGELLRERTADLQRVKAEYDNYRKRVRRDHLAVREIAVANVLTGLLPVLDAIDAARGQGAVTDGFALVADALEGRLCALGLAAFGTEGDRFDPSLHEAVAHVPAPPGTPHPVCAKVHRPGYRVGTHLLRPAEVTVAQPPD